jgi:hypothetical protein
LCARKSQRSLAWSRVTNYFHGEEKLNAGILILAWELAILFAAGYKLREPRRLKDWSRVEANVVRIDKRNVVPVGGSAGLVLFGTSWYATVSYYVAGEQFEALVPCHKPDANIKRLWPGKVVTVAYDRNNASIAFVDTEIARQAKRDALIIVVGAQLLVFMAINIYVLSLSS